MSKSAQNGGATQGEGTQSSTDTMQDRLERIRADHAAFDTPEKMAAHRLDPNAHGGATGFDDDDVEVVERQAITREAISPRRIEDFISTKQFVPNLDWINREVVGKGRGTHIQLGRFLGIAVKAEVQSNQHEGKTLESVKLHAKTTFEATSFLTGEVYEAPFCFLPKSFSIQVMRALESVKDDPHGQALLDITIGCEATGKTIPYRWTVTSYVNRHDPELEALRNRRDSAPDQDRRQLLLNTVANPQRTLSAPVAH